jgi:hypothetical protein
VASLASVEDVLPLAVPEEDVPAQVDPAKRDHAQAAKGKEKLTDKKRKRVLFVPSYIFKLQSPRLNQHLDAERRKRRDYRQSCRIQLLPKTLSLRYAYIPKSMPFLLLSMRASTYRGPQYDGKSRPYKIEKKMKTHAIANCVVCTSNGI